MDPVPPAPELDVHDGVGPSVLKLTVPVDVFNAFSDTKLAVESAQSVPCEFIPLIR